MFSSSNGKVGDFTQSLAIELMQGDLNIASGDTVTAQSVNLTADAGNLTLAGVMKRPGPMGGKVALYAMDNLNVESTGAINAYGTSGAGGM